MEYLGPIIIVVIVGVQYWVTGRFLAELERDNPEKFKEVWPASESVLAILFPFRFGLLYVIPGTYEHWDLGPAGLRLAKHVKFVTWILVALILLALGSIVASVF